MMTDRKIFIISGPAFTGWNMIGRWSMTGVRDIFCANFTIFAKSAKF
jgi:hypothetical protein